MPRSAFFVESGYENGMRACRGQKGECLKSNILENVDFEKVQRGTSKHLNRDKDEND